MLYLDLIKLIFADFKKRKFSTFLTFFSISLGIMAVFVIILVSTGFENSLTKQFEQLGSNRIYITPVNSNLANLVTNKYKSFSDFEINLLKKQPYVKSVYGYYIKKVQLKYGSEFRVKSIFGMNLDKKYFQDYNLKIDKGRFPKINEKYSLVIGSAVIKNLFSKDIVIGSNLYINNTKFKVVGILKSIGNPQDDKNIYANLNTLRDLTNGGNSIGFADVLIQNNIKMGIAKKNLKILLEKRLGKDKVDFLTPDQILKQVNSILDIVKYTLGGIAVVSLIVGALGIINTMFVIVTEKIKEIGIMKSIGATNFQILFLFTVQAGLFGLIGAILGIILGSLTSGLFEKIAISAGFSFLKITIDPMVVFYLLLFGFFMGIISGFVPAYRASKILIIDAIRK